MKNSMVFSGNVSFISDKVDRNGRRRVRLGVYQSSPSYDAYGNPAGFLTTLITGSVAPELVDSLPKLEKKDPVEVRGTFSSWSPLERDAKGKPKKDAQGNNLYGFPVMQINFTSIQLAEEGAEVVEKTSPKPATEENPAEATTEMVEDAELVIEEEDDLPF